MALSSRMGWPPFVLCIGFMLFSFGYGLAYWSTGDLVVSIPEITGTGDAIIVGRHRIVGLPARIQVGTDAVNTTIHFHVGLWRKCVENVMYLYDHDYLCASIDSGSIWLDHDFSSDHRLLAVEFLLSFALASYISAVIANILLICNCSPGRKTTINYAYKHLSLAMSFVTVILGVIGLALWGPIHNTIEGLDGATDVQYGAAFILATMGTILPAIHIFLFLILVREEDMESYSLME